MESCKGSFYLFCGFKVIESIPYKVEIVRTQSSPVAFRATELKYSKTKRCFDKRFDI